MKKTILTLMMVLMMGVVATGTAYASEEKTKTESSEEKTEEKSSEEKTEEKSEDEKSEKSEDEKSGEETTTEVTATAEDFNITTNDDNTVTFQRADGTAMAGINVTVKNTLADADGDISRDEFTTDENGVFDYSAWVENDVYILRLTDPDSTNTLEYIIETGELTISAGKNKSGDGQSNTKTNLYMIIGGVAAVLVIGVVTVIVMVKQKKKKAAFAEKAGKKATKKK